MTATTKIVIDGYLTEQKLAKALKQIVGSSWGGSELRVPNSKRRWDMWFRDRDSSVIVEFDGDEHYRNTLKIKADHEKDDIALENGFKVVRVPYWVQLDTMMLKHWFGIDALIEQGFPHGFIVTKIFPASFCAMGIARFERELAALPQGRESGGYRVLAGEGRGARGRVREAPGDGEDGRVASVLIVDSRGGCAQGSGPGENRMAQDFTAGLMRLVLDPQFAAFERLANRPNLFRIVGRTFTETWHSMLLGWLLDPKGSHGLGGFALQRLLLAAADGSTFAPEEAQTLAIEVAMFGDFRDAVVTPNERSPKEMQIKVGNKAGRLDVFVSGIKLGGKANGEAVIAIEQKVFAPPDTEQCKMYSAWLEAEHSGKTHIAILLAPLPDEERPIDDDRWFVLDYQSLHDDVLVPVLEHPDLDAVVRPLIEQYADALRIPMNGTKLAVSEEEKEIAKKIFSQHQPVFEALFEVLASSGENPELEALVQASRNAKKEPISVNVDGEALTGVSGADFLKSAVQLLDRKAKLGAILPFSTGTKRYLVATEKKHPTGNEFLNPVQVEGNGGATYYIEANVSRDGALKYGLRLLTKAGCTVEMPNG